VFNDGDILVRHGLLDNSQLDVLRESSHEAVPVVQAAIRKGFVSEQAAFTALAKEAGLEYVDVATVQPDLSLLEGFPQRLIYRDTIFPIRKEDGVLVVATSDPYQLYPLDEVSAATGLPVRAVLASREAIQKQITTHLGVGSETVEVLLAQTDEEDVQLLEEIASDGSELSEMALEASVVRLVNEILLEAIESRASDVHIETQPSGLVVRYRVDGMLQTQPIPPEINRFRAAIISRLKIMAHLNIAERRLPQDGRIKLKVRGRDVDVRVSVIPMIHGEGIVMRILDKNAMAFDLRSLGMSQQDYERFEKLIKMPHGIILVTGPTGSGKTSTLYSSLLQIKDEDTKIITTEDPVEYQLEGINQIQVHPKIGLTFASSLRSILRHDPDIVLVGEIRDLETAENAIQASLTGHLVFSTLHTNDAASAFARLSDMGVEPFLVASTVEAVMAQRLVRRLCPECREAHHPQDDELPEDFPRDQLEQLTRSGGQIYRQTGCRECRQLGYQGRMGIFELLVTSEKVRQLAHEGVSTYEIRKAGVEGGMVTLRQDGWRKVLEGKTSIDEVLRVTRGDHM